MRASTKKNMLVAKYSKKEYNLSMINKVDLLVSDKDLNKIPKHVVFNLRMWILDIEKKGLEETRKIRGWNDHSLKGNRQGQRAVYLNRKWRAVYELRGTEIKIVTVIEVHPHDY
jgi:plasmid maintenance system killer protein